MQVHIEHNVDKGLGDKPPYDFYYNFYDYSFDFGGRRLVARSYRDEARKATIKGMFRGDKAVHSMSEIYGSEELRQVVRYLLDRDFEIQVPGGEAYESIDLKKVGLSEETH